MCRDRHDVNFVVRYRSRIRLLLRYSRCLRNIIDFRLDSTTEQKDSATLIAHYADQRCYRRFHRLTRGPSEEKFREKLRAVGARLYS
jgi:hypothetical protein